MASGNGLSSRVPLQGDAFPFVRSGSDRSEPGKPVPGAGIDGFVGFSGDRESRLFDDHQHHHRTQNQGWGVTRDGDSSSGEDDDDDVDGDDDYEDADEGAGFVPMDGGSIKAKNTSSGSSQSSSKKDRDGRPNSHHSALVLSGVVFAADGNGGGGNLGEMQYQQSRAGDNENVVTVAENAHYHAFLIQGEGGSSMHHEKEENGCGFSGRRDSGLASSYWETLRSHLSDPITGVLMEDAMVLSCGHSFGSDGMQHVYKMKACYKCSQPVMEGLVRPNLSLHAAVQAFRREEEAYLFRASKKRKERLEQEKYSYDDPSLMDHSRGKGVQFPFAVSDRVLIKGNKRTPLRFVGRTAVVTTQCLNGWYVVKTLDNAESVKLQYRSLEKLGEDQCPNLVSNKAQMPNWL